MLSRTRRALSLAVSLFPAVLHTGRGGRKLSRQGRNKRTRFDLTKERKGWTTRKKEETRQPRAKTTTTPSPLSSREEVLLLLRWRGPVHNRHCRREAVC